MAPRRWLLLAAVLLLGSAVAQTTPAPAGQWHAPAGDDANTRYSPLQQIDRHNVAQLTLAWQFATGSRNGLEAAPLVVGTTLYIITPFPNHLFAIDLTTRRVKWTFAPQPDPAAQGVACCDTVNRGVTFADGRLFFNTLDNQTVAVEAETGRELWRTTLGDIRRGETMTMAPLVVKGKVLVGNSGGEMGVRGWLTALDAATGRIAWRAYSTGPDAEVLIGPHFRPFYGQDRGRDLGVSSWPPDAWRTGGGNAWGFLSYDPKLDLVYYGTANPGPWNPEQRPGDNRWTAGLFARRPDSGEAIWFYQTSPHDLHDYDGVNENVLVDLPWAGGAVLPLLLHPDRNGYLYTIDRATGQVLAADAYGPITTSTGVDLATGKLLYNPKTEPKNGRTVRDICPASPGAKDWQPSAWSPRTRLLYLPHQNLCQDAQTHTASYIAGTPYVGADVKMRAGPGGQRGAVTAWDPLAHRAAWQVKEDLPVWSGALATAGDLVFYGTMDGWFKALDARSGQLLWRFKTETGVIGQPMTYRGPDGRQYVAVLAGVGGWAGKIVSLGLDGRDGTAGLGFVNAMKDLPDKTRAGGQLYVFALH